MSKKEVCISCFCEKEGAVCSRCGYAESENRKNSLLPARTLLEGRYLTGEVIGIDSASADYKALDTEKKMIVEIQEYFPGMEVQCDNLSLGISCHVGEGGLGVGCSCKPNRI
jgi:hypothetical protein